MITTDLVLLGQYMIAWLENLLKVAQLPYAIHGIDSTIGELDRSSPPSHTGETATVHRGVEVALSPPAYLY